PNKKMENLVIPHFWRSVVFYGSTCEVPNEDNSEGYYAETTLAELVQDMLSHLNASPGSFELEVESITATLNEWVTTEETLQELVELIYTQSTSIPNFAYTGARLCNYLSQHLAISSSSRNFRHLLLQRCHTEYERRAEAVKGDEATQKNFHSFVLFLGELYLNLEVKGQTGRATVLLLGLKDLIDALLSNPVDGNIICAVKLLKLTGSVLDDDWKQSGKTYMDDVMSRLRNIQLDASCSRDVKAMLLNLLELKSSGWGRVGNSASAIEATPDNDPNYFMNEPTFYTADGVPFTAADPEYSEKYQEIVDRECYYPDFSEENGTEDCYDEDDGMDPEIEEAYEKFCLESERKRRQ
uniref:Polyadenylate-binding protein-interacting protein 1 n=1 Tax=Scleropages formosus TaxID=113540 RepID=A0A8C9VHI8_SCLFO